MFFRNNRRFLEIDFFIDDLSFNYCIGKHVRQVNIFKAVVLRILGTVEIRLETFLDFDGFGITWGSQKSKLFLGGMFGEVEDVGFFLIIEPDPVSNVWRFEPVFFSAPAHV